MTLIVRRGEVVVPPHHLHVTQLQERILWGLAAQLAPVPIRDMIDLCYGDDPEGGPLYADKIIHNRICYLNKVLPRLGWRIAKDGYNGYLLREVA